MWLSMNEPLLPLSSTSVPLYDYYSPFSHIITPHPSQYYRATINRRSPLDISTGAFQSAGGGGGVLESTPIERNIFRMQKETLQVSPPRGL